MEQAEESVQQGVAQVGEIVRSDPATVSPNTTLEQCLPLVADDDTPLAVLDKRKRLLGIVTRPTLIEAMQVDTANNQKS